MQYKNIIIPKNAVYGLTSIPKQNNIQLNIKYEFLEYFVYLIK